MDRKLLADAVGQLDELCRREQESYAGSQAIAQFDALLGVAHDLYPSRVDIKAISSYGSSTTLMQRVLSDAVRRLRIALELRPPGSAVETFGQISWPPDIPKGLVADVSELESAVGLGLTKTVLLLAGSVAESLLLTRHPDESDRGPGLRALVKEAAKQRLFGRDTLRHLETFADYRDLIHPRAESRNQISRSETRIESAILALKLLCSELEDRETKYVQGTRES